MGPLSTNDEKAPSLCPLAVAENTKKDTESSFKEGFEDDECEDSPPKRDQWSSRLDFILSVVGFAVGLGNIWRFPYLCYKNGGGAFFIPYLVMLVFGGIPIFFLEVALGQFTSRGALGAWRIAPLFMGIGLCTSVVMLFMNAYYIVVLAWDLVFMAHSFTATLPWSHCDNPWNTPRCHISVKPSFNETISNVTNSLSMSNETAFMGNATQVDPVVEFWENKILQISPGIDQPNGLVWELVVALLVAWILCYVCIWKGVKWTGKVVYFTAVFPYLVLTVLVIRGVTLDGSVDGIIFYLKPDFSKLSDSQVWLDAGTQVFYSYAVGTGSLIALGSYNKINNNCYRDCILICCINCSTSVFAGFAVFSVLGFMAKEQGVDISEVAASGPGLAFIAYPKAVTKMPLSPLWAVLFFFMILLVGLDTQFVSTEGILTVFLDTFPQLRRRRALVTLVYCVISFIMGLSMVSRGGMYVFQIFDYYCCSGMVLLWIGFFECFALSWVYGGKRFYDNVETMIGYRINPFLKICWTYITPTLSMAIFVFMWAVFKPLTYNRVYEYPAWAQAMGMCLGFVSMICIPGYAIIKMLVTPGSIKQRWKELTTPVLKPETVPASWPDAAYLRLVGRKGQRIDDKTLLLSRGNPAVRLSAEQQPLAVNKSSV